jgi:WD40 repeat protein
MKVVKDPVVPPLRASPRDRVGDIDKTIDTICMKALANDPRDRYVTAQAFADDLTKWLQGEEVKVVSPVVRIRQRKAVRMLILAVSLTVAALLAGLYIVTKNTPTAEGDLVKARAYLSHGDFLNAHFHFKMALGVEPDNAEAKAGLAQASAKLSNQVSQELTEKQERLSKTLENIDDLMNKAAMAKDAAELAKIKKEIEEKQKQVEEVSTDIALTRGKLEGIAPESQVPVETPVENEDPWAKPVNLMTMVVPSRDAVNGLWMRTSDGLTSGDDPNAQIRIAYEPPEAYTLRAVFQRTRGSGSVNFLLTAKGKLFGLQLGGWGNTVSGFETIGGNVAKANPTGTSVPCVLVNDRDYTVEIQVNVDGIKALLDGKLLAEHKTDFSDLGLSPLWKETSPALLGLATHESPTRFKSLVLAEFKGKGRRAPAFEEALLESVNVRRSTLRNGLIGSYYFGTSFEKLAVRRIDGSPDFRWDVRAPWSDGPIDSFSVRWTGFLDVPRTGTYTFFVNADDGARLFIGDRQVLVTRERGLLGIRTGTCGLKAGLHPIRIEFFESVNRANISLLWGEGTEDVIPGPLSRNILFHDPEDAVRFSYAPRSIILTGHVGSVDALAFSPDTDLLVSAGEDRKIRFWNPAEKRVVETAGGHTIGILALDFSPDGSMFASAGYGQAVLLHDGTTKEVIRSLKAHTALVLSLDFHPRKPLLASGSLDGRVILWNTGTGEIVRELKHPGDVTAVAFSPDGRWLATGCSDRTVRVWETETGTEVQALTAHADGIEAVAFHPEGTMLASGSLDYQVKLWDPSSGELLQTLEGHRKTVTSLDFSPDGKLLASGSEDTTIRTWELPGGQEKQLLPGHSGPVHRLIFDRSGSILVSGGFDGNIHVWSVEGH